MSATNEASLELMPWAVQGVNQSEHAGSLLAVPISKTVSMQAEQPYSRHVCCVPGSTVLLLTS
jgi:4-hydroxy-L-threonine phosphate dehydrogenase PdxA